MLTYGIFASAIDSPICNNCAKKKSDRRVWDLDRIGDLNLKEVSEAGFELTGLYLSPDILNPVKWAELAHNTLPAELRSDDTIQLKEFENDESKTNVTTIFSFSKTLLCSSSDMVFNIGDAIMKNQGSNFLVDLWMGNAGPDGNTGWQTKDKDILESRFGATTMHEGWRLTKAGVKSACQAMAIADVYMKNLHPTSM
jgi:hypothetical protein